MFRVQFRDAADPARVLVNTFTLPFDPADGTEIRVRQRARDVKSVNYRIVRHYLYEAVIDDPHESGIALLVTPLPQ